MTGEELGRTRNDAVDWGKLKDVEMVAEQPGKAVEVKPGTVEIGREAAGKLGGKILGVMKMASAAEALNNSETVDEVAEPEVSSGESQEAPDENLRVKPMRENWGNFEESRELFGSKTEMVPYEYGVIAENMPWEEFVQFCEQMSELGGKSEQEYENALFNKASELCDKGLCLPRSLEIAVRRYNVAKQFGEKRPERFYYVTNLKQATRGLTFLGGKMIEGDYGADDKGDGRDPRRIHLQYDRVNEHGVEQPGLNPEAGMVTMVIDGSVIDDDEFDPVGGEPAMNRVEKAKILAVLGRDEMIADMFRVAQHQEGARSGADYEVMSVAQWQNGGEPVETKKERERRRHELAKETIFRPDKKELRTFVDGFLEKVDDGELKRLVEIYKQDSTQGMEAAIEYYAGVFGIKAPRMVWSEKEKRKEARRRTVTDELHFSAKDKTAKPERMLATAGHEMFHEYQSNLRDAWAAGKLQPGTLEEKQAKLLYYNLGHHDGGPFYAGQLDEMQAYHFGDTLKKRLKRLKRR